MLDERRSTMSARMNRCHVRDLDSGRRCKCRNLRTATNAHMWVRQEQIRDLEPCQQCLVQRTAIYWRMFFEAITVAVDHTISLRTLFVQKSNWHKLLVWRVDQIRKYS